MSGVAWTADGTRLVLSASQGQDHLLWLVSAHDGSVALLPTPIIPALNPSVSRSTNRLVYENQSVDRDIWRLRIGAEDAGGAGAGPFVGSTRVDCCAEFSPDGSRVLFLSTRSGHKEVWICNSDGSDARRLTSLEALSVWQPRWSPDGTRIAFSAFLNEHARAFVMDVESGLTRCLSLAPRHEIVDSWSRDGRWIYRHCDSDSGWFAERVHPDGAEPTRLNIDGYPVVFETRGGDVLFLKDDAPGIWKARPFADEARPASGEAELLVEPKHMGGWTDVTFADEGVYFVRRSPEGEILGLFDYSRGAADTLAHLEGLANAFLSVSPDRKTILFDRPERDEIDVILVPSFSARR
jgi:dipeptidyl aminopeptidase/acylaminoacyl peptidase